MEKQELVISFNIKRDVTGLTDEQISRLSNIISSDLNALACLSTNIKEIYPTETLAYTYDDEEVLTEDSKVEFTSPCLEKDWDYISKCRLLTKEEFMENIDDISPDTVLRNKDYYFPMIDDDSTSRAWQLYKMLPIDQIEMASKQYDKYDFKLDECYRVQNTLYSILKNINEEMPALYINTRDFDAFLPEIKRELRRTEQKIKFIKNPCIVIEKGESSKSVESRIDEFKELTKQNPVVTYDYGFYSRKYNSKKILSLPSIDEAESGKMYQTLFTGFEDVYPHVGFGISEFTSIQLAVKIGHEKFFDRKPRKLQALAKHMQDVTGLPVIIENGDSTYTIPNESLEEAYNKLYEDNGYEKPEKEESKCKVINFADFK